MPKIIRKFDRYRIVDVTPTHYSCVKKFVLEVFNKKDSMGMPVWEDAGHEHLAGTKSFPEILMAEIFKLETKSTNLQERIVYYEKSTEENKAASQSNRSVL